MVDIMSRTVTFQPSQQLAGFIDNLIQSGVYHNQSEVVRAGLRLLQEQIADSKLSQLRQLLAEGEASGEAIAWNKDEFLARMREPHDHQDSGIKPKSR